MADRPPRGQGYEAEATCDGADCLWDAVSTPTRGSRPALTSQERTDQLRGDAIRAVSFHQVVPPVLSEEAGVAKLQHFLGGPDERSSECPAHAAQSSRPGAAGGGRGTDAEGRRGCFRGHRPNPAQRGGAAP